MDKPLYIVNMVYQAAVLALLPLVASVVMSGVEARSLGWLLQLLPVSFVYRIRGNQEQPLLMCFLALLYGAPRTLEPGVDRPDGGGILRARVDQGRVCDVRVGQCRVVARARTGVGRRYE